MAGLNLMDMIMSAAGPQAAQQAGARAGLESAQAQSAIAALLPAVSAALKKQTASQEGLAGLLGALQSGSHSQYIENPATLNSDATVADGNGILGHIFGSKDVSREVASAAANKTGLELGALKKILPLVAAMAMGSLSKQSSGLDLKSIAAGAVASKLMGGNSSAGGLASIAAGLLGGGKPSGAAGLLGSLLEAGGDQDDGLMDNVLAVAMKKFL